MTKIEKLQKMKTDHEKIQFLIKEAKTKNSSLIVMLDNDQTYIKDSNDDGDEYVDLDNAFGYGVETLLEVLNIDCEWV